MVTVRFCCNGACERVVGAARKKNSNYSNAVIEQKDDGRLRCE